MTIMSIQDLSPPDGYNWRLSPHREIPMPNGKRQARPTMQSITREVATETGLSVAEIRGRRRYMALVWARYRIWHRIREELRTVHGQPFSYPMIGEHFGMDSSSIVSGVQKYRKWLDEQARLDAGEVAS